MEYKAISKKTMRSKDFKALRAKKPGYCENRKEHERCAFPNSAWILHVPAIEISVTQAQAFFDKYGIRVETGW